MTGVSQARKSKTSIPGRGKNICKQLEARLKNWERFDVI